MLKFQRSVNLSWKYLYKIGSRREKTQRLQFYLSWDGFSSKTINFRRILLLRPGSAYDAINLWRKWRNSGASAIFASIGAVPIFGSGETNRIETKQRRKSFFRAMMKKFFSSNDEQNPDSAYFFLLQREFKLEIISQNNSRLTQSWRRFLRRVLLSISICSLSQLQCLRLLRYWLYPTAE